VDLTGIAQDVLGFLMTEGINLSDDLGQAESVLQEQIRRIGARALELHLQQHKLGYEGSSRACLCGQNQRFVEHRPKTLATLMGPVTIRRAYYRCSSCGAGWLPYDWRVGLGEGQESVGLAKAACLCGIHEPFESAANLLRELTGQRISERTLERLVHHVGGVVRTEEESQAAGMERWDAPAAEVSPKRLYLAVDGVMVHRTDGWKEAKTATCYWEDADGTRHSRYAVRWESAEAFKAFVWALACRCGLGQAQEVVLLGDGAAWIWDHIGSLVKEKATLIVDWYHALEHVWACGNALHGEGTPAARAWVEPLKTLLWDGNVREILGQLEDERVRSRSPTRREAMQALLTYLGNQDDRLAYDRFRAAGMDIGSGRVEAACKHVVGMRMKRNGMRWSATGAQATLSLRCAWLNGDWDRVWDKRPLAA
jgi:hypothetical protein